MNKKNLFGIAALALAIVLLTACLSGSGSGGGGGGGGTGPVTTTTVFRNADTELTITQTTSRSARALANGSGTYVLKQGNPLETKSEGAVTISGGGVTLRFTPRTSGQQAFSVTITGGQIAEITIKVTGGSTITISGLVEATPEAFRLAADINGMTGQSEGSVGRAEANGATVRITGGFVDFRSNIEVPTGVTLDVTESGAMVGLHDVTLTVNGTVNAKSQYIRLEDSGQWGIINGSGTINLQGGGHLFHVQGNKNVANPKLTIDGVTLAGVTDNDDSLVGVSVGGEFVLKSGTIRGNSTTGAGGGVSVYKSNYKNKSGTTVEGSGTFTMTGGSISGNTAYNGGGVFVGDTGTFTMNGGAISGNAANDGGGVCVGDNANFTLEGGTIGGNTASNTGGGVVVWNSSTFTLNGGTVYGSSAEGGNANTAAAGAALRVDDNATANWGTTGSYTKGGASQTVGSAIVPPGTGTDETLIATKP